jgi:hypothetical protein
MEKPSSIERVVGNISDTEKERILQERAEMFDDQVFDGLDGKEREKTPEEQRIISLANEITNQVRAKYGLGDFNVPPKNIHIVREEAWPNEGMAVYNSMLQAVAVCERREKIEFMYGVIHEMIHFKSYNALQMTSEEDSKLAEYRLGLTVETRDGKIMYFKNLNEAVTEEITKRLAGELVKMFSKDPLFAEEINRTRDIISRYPDAIDKDGKPLFDDDVFYAEVRGVDGNKTNIRTTAFTYKHERKILNVLIDKIFEKDAKKFKDREEVFEVFACGMMTGNILPIGRLIDGSFGVGTLRRIGELDKNIDGQLKFVSALG